jgi:hypothetical protein
MPTTTEAVGYEPFVETPADASAEETRAAMAQWGYVFVRALAPEEKVLEVRRQVLELCAEAGWLDPDQPLMDGIAAPGH